MKYKLLILSILFCVSSAQASITAWVKPDQVVGVKQEQMSLNGVWKFRYTPNSKWYSVKVPGELVMQGFGIEHDKAYLYERDLMIPQDYQGKHTVIRFDGVYSYARLFVNNKFVCDHFGGFTRWDADITSFVKTGKKNIIRLEITDRKDDISYASGYAHHPIGGILRGVSVYALPYANVSDLKIETLLDSTYTDATLRLSMKSSAQAKIDYQLIDPKGKVVNLQGVSKTLSKGENTHQFSVRRPLKWDAEHPNLYKLMIEVNKGTDQYYSFTKEIGFRDIKIVGNRMLVNGMPVKLRGACRHDMHPTLGRSTNSELDSLDVMLFKRSNMNFVRTSHYPPSEDFMKFCDRMGLYVECETAICFVDTYRQKNYAPGASQNDTTFTSRYLSQLQEMVKHFVNHSSVLFWSIGNESNYGTNFQQSYDWTKAWDKTRPVIFSYPGTVPKDKVCYDILSFHYPGVEGNIEQFGPSTNGFQTSKYPSIFDEWAHVPCYTYTTLQDDPNIREFWGISLDKMWGNLFNAPGGLGGAIWGYIDETFMVPALKEGTPYWNEFAKTSKPKEWQGKCVGYGEWGIVDVWRREKPEFWGTKKAYSPIRVLQTQISSFAPNAPLYVPIYNRFDHTWLNEVTLKYTYNGLVKSITLPAVAPHQKGTLEIPAANWNVGDVVLVEFFDSKGQLIDADNLTLGTLQHNTSSISKADKELIVDDQSDFFIVRGADFEIPFNKNNGLMEKVTSKGQVIIEKGPFINLDLNFNHNTGPEVREKARNFILNDNNWKKKTITWAQSGTNVFVKLIGNYDDISVTFDIQIKATGEMDITFQTNGQPDGWLRESGVKFYMSQNVSQLSWKRKGHWSYYPEQSFAGNAGSTSLYNANKVPYGAKPNQAWVLDTHNYYYFADKGAISEQPLTNKAKGMKENISEYTLSVGQATKISVVSPDHSLGCRLYKTSDNTLLMYVNTRWDYPEIGWGDYCKTLDVTPNYGHLNLKF